MAYKMSQEFSTVSFDITLIMFACWGNDWTGTVAVWAELSRTEEVHFDFAGLTKLSNIKSTCLCYASGGDRQTVFEYKRFLMWAGPRGHGYAAGVDEFRPKMFDLANSAHTCLHAVFLTKTGTTCTHLSLAPTEIIDPRIKYFTVVFDTKKNVI